MRQACAASLVLVFISLSIGHGMSSAGTAYPVSVLAMREHRMAKLLLSFTLLNSAYPSLHLTTLTQRSAAYSVTMSRRHGLIVISLLSRLFLLFHRILSS